MLYDSLCLPSSCLNSPNERGPVAITLHRATRRQSVALPNRSAVHDRIEHLRRERISFAQQRPFVLADGVFAHQIAADQFAQRMRVRTICKRVDGLRFDHVALHFHVFDAACRNGAGRAQQ